MLSEHELDKIRSMIRTEVYASNRQQLFAVIAALRESVDAVATAQEPICEGVTKQHEELGRVVAAMKDLQGGFSNLCQKLDDVFSSPDEPRDVREPWQSDADEPWQQDDDEDELGGGRF